MTRCGDTSHKVAAITHGLVGTLEGCMLLWHRSKAARIASPSTKVVLGIMIAFHTLSVVEHLQRHWRGEK